MARNRRGRDPLPTEFKSVQDLQDFWDTHSVADYDDLLEDVQFDVDLRSRSNFIAVETTLMKELVKRAHIMGVSTETLVNVWLSKQLREAHGPGEKDV